MLKRTSLGVKLKMKSLTEMMVRVRVIKTQELKGLNFFMMYCLITEFIKN